MGLKLSEVIEALSNNLKVNGDTEDLRISLIQGENQIDFPLKAVSMGDSVVFTHVVKELKND